MSNRIWITLEALLWPIKTQINKFKSDTQKDLQESSQVPLKIKEDDLLRVKKQINEVKWEINDLNARARALKIDLKANNYPSDLKALQDVNTNLTAQKNKLADLRDEAKKLESQNLPWYFSNLSSKLSDTIKRIGLFTAAFTIINQTKNAIVWATQASIEFESALAWVNKTTDFTVSELEAMDNSLKKLSTEIPLTYVELAKITELWGQIWVAKENLAEFTDVMAKLKTTTNLTSEESINNFAKFNNVMGISWDKIKTIASVLVKLGNNSAATETEILTFSNRVSAAWKLSWISAGWVMAISSAFVSAWIQAEAWWTAVSSVLSDINKSVITWWKNLEIYAATAWQTSEEFAKSWREDADSAFAEFIDNLWKAWDDAYNILGQLEQDNVRTLRAFLSTANSAVTVKDALTLMNAELENVNALEDEFSKRAETSAAKLQLQRNEWVLIWQEIWDNFVPILISVNQWLIDLVKWLKNSTTALYLLITAVWTLAYKYMLWALVPAISATWTALVTRLIPAITAKVTAIYAARTATIAYTISIWWLWAAFTALLWPIGLLVAWLLSIAYAYDQIRTAKKLEAQAAKNTANVAIAENEAVMETVKNIEDLRKKRTDLISKTDKASQKELATTGKLLELEEARLDNFDLMDKWAKLTNAEDIRNNNIAKQENQRKIDALREELKLNKEIVDEKIKPYTPTWWGGGGWTSELEKLLKEEQKLREEELKAIEEDNKKRADYLDNYNEKQLKSSKKTAEWVIKITQKQLDYQLEIIATAQWEELEQAIDLADKLKAIIKKNTDYVEDKVQQEKEIYENAADYIEELLDTSKDKIDDLQKQLDKLQEIWKSQDEKIAERRLKIEQEIADTKEKIAEFDKNAVYWASQLTEEQLKQIGKWVLGTWADWSEITWDSVLKAQEELNKLNELEKELIENSEYLKQSVYEEKLAYDAKSETMKIVADMREKEKETLADLWLEYETAEEAIKGIEQAIKDEQTAREISLATQSNLTKQFTTLLWEETDKQIIFQNKFQEAVQASINKQRELNALLWASREASNNSASNNSNQVVNITNNINWAWNVNDTARKVTSAEALALRGSTPSSNS